MLTRRLAAAATVTLAAVGVLATPIAGTAAGSKCVALVVDFSHVGGSVSTACVTVPTSASGSDVLVAGHHKVTFDPRYGNDFVCAIDGVPAGGCHATDDTHYWVYYHRAPGSSAWHVSQEGAGTYKPANTSTEGWVYDDGASPAPTPRDVPYPSICSKQQTSSKPTPAATSSTQQTTPRATRPSSHESIAPTRTPPATSTASMVLATHAPSSPPAVAAPTRSTALAAARVHRHRLHRVPLGLVLGLIAAAGLGAAALVRLRRPTG